jgi:hypothetical protein
MSKNKSSYKKKYKGVRYIAQRLTKYQKGKYKNYTSALPDARKFFTELKKDKKKVTIKNIWALSRSRKLGRPSSKKKQVKKPGVPELDKNLADLSFYFETMDYPTWILRCSKDLYFVSEISPSALPDIQGGTSVSYEDYFSDYVNYINGMASLATPGDNRYETEWLVTCTEPKYNKAKKRYESKIISVNSDGTPTDYGFDPKKPNLLPRSVQTTGAVKKTKEPEPKEPTSQEINRIKEIRAEIAELRKDVRDGFISKEDYGKAIIELTKKLEKGGKI